MLSVVDRLELLEHADKLARDRDFARLVELVQLATAEEPESDPLLEFYQLFATTQLGYTMEAVAVMKAIGPRFELLRDTRLYRRFRNICGILLTHTGRLSEARAAFVEVLSTSEAHGDLQLSGDAVMNLGVVEDMLGRWDEALAAHWRALSVFTQLADHVMVAGCHHNLGMTYRQLRMVDAADSHFQIALELYQRYGTRLDVIGTVLERSLLLSGTGDALVAETVARTAYKEVRQLRNVRLVGEAQRVLGMILLRGKKYPQARRYFTAALSSARRSENLLLEAECSAEFAKLPTGTSEMEPAAWRKRAVELYLAVGCLGRASEVRDDQA